MLRYFRLTPIDIDVQLYNIINITVTITITDIWMYLRTAWSGEVDEKADLDKAGLEKWVFPQRQVVQGPRRKTW